jgi:hypothetical protein
MIACGTISGTGTSATITFGTDVRFDSAGTYTTQGIYDPNSNQSLITWSGKVRSATVSGTDIVLGTTTLIVPGLSPQTDPGGIIYDPVSKKIAIVRNGGTGVTGTVFHFNVDNITIDLATGTFFELDLGRENDAGKSMTYNIKQITVSNAAAAHVSSFVLKITQGDFPRDFLWSELTAFKWDGGTAPTLTTTDNAVDILSFTTYDYGTTWHGAVVGQNYS